jgi:hypothetical protein
MSMPSQENFRVCRITVEIAAKHRILVLRQSAAFSANNDMLKPAPFASCGD